MIFLLLTILHCKHFVHLSQVRTEYLCLFHDLVANTDYAEHCHRRKEFNDCFNKIVEDEENDVESDKYIIRKIGENFPQLFVIPR